MNSYIIRHNTIDRAVVRAGGLNQKKLLIESENGLNQKIKITGC